ncbi:MAG: hypothetical protein DRJ98_03775 [Thermoprotei archaeon]|nr:MAG: hypothetical protein DRJ98_03775 [Thermoprotei archaeon]
MEGYYIGTSVSAPEKRTIRVKATNNAQELELPRVQGGKIRRRPRRDQHLQKPILLHESLRPT